MFVFLQKGGSTGKIEHVFGYNANIFIVSTTAKMI